MKSRLVVVALFAFTLFTFVSCRRDPDPVVPIACFTTSSNNVDTGQVVTFNASCSKNGVEYFWVFGDSTTATGSSVAHTWHHYGNKNVALTVATPNHASDTYIDTISVDPRWRFVGAFDVTQNCGYWVNPYVMTVSLSNVGLQISNFNGINWNVISTTPVLDSTYSIDIVTEGLVDGYNDHWDLSGTATINASGDILTFYYFVDNTQYYADEGVPLGQYSCNAVGTRQ